MRQGLAHSASNTPGKRLSNSNGQVTWVRIFMPTLLPLRSRKRGRALMKMTSLGWRHLNVWCVGSTAMRCPPWLTLTRFCMQAEISFTRDNIPTYIIHLPFSSCIIRQWKYKNNPTHLVLVHLHWSIALMYFENLGPLWYMQSIAAILGKSPHILFACRFESNEYKDNRVLLFNTAHSTQVSYDLGEA